MKTKELLQTIEELRTAVATVIEAADWLTQQFSAPTDAEPPEPEPARPTVTLEMVRAVLAEKSRAGMTAQVRELLHKHGAAKLSEIDPAHYEALLADAEELTDAT